MTEETWNDITNLPTEKSCRVRVKLDDNRETLAYFYADKMDWIEIYGKKPCYFWDCNTKRPLFNVTRWNHIKGMNNG